MKKLFALASLLWASVASAQFVPGQLLTAQALNSQFALYAPLAGATFSGPVTIPGLTGTGTITFPANSLPLTYLAQQSSNTVLANVTGGLANVTAFAMPSCSTSASALNWTTNTGFTCNAAVNAATLGGATFASPGPIGSTTASTGAFTNLSSSGTVSGTGFSTYLASPPAIGGTAANTGAFTTLSSTGNFTPSQTNGIVGTTTNNNANAGSVGEYITNTGSSVSVPTSGASLNITSISLTAGDWDVTGDLVTVPAGTTTTTTMAVSVGTTTGTLAGFPAQVVVPTVTTAGFGNTITAPVVRFSFASTTTVFLVANITFATSTMQANGFIRARRVR